MNAILTAEESATLSHALQYLTGCAHETGFRFGPMQVTTSAGRVLTIHWADESGGLYVVDFNEPVEQR